MISATGVGLIIGGAALVLGLSFIAAGVALLNGDKTLCEDLLLNVSAGFLGILAAVAFASAMLSFYRIAFTDAFTVDLIIGVGVATGLSQLNRKLPLFRICGATK